MSDEDEMRGYWESQNRARSGQIYDPSKDNYWGFKSGIPDEDEDKGRERNGGSYGYSKDDYWEAGCFPGSVIISTPGGGQRIEAIKPKQVVLAFDPVRHELVETTVNKVLAHRAETIYEISYLDSAACLRVTKNHSVLTKRGWISIKCLKSTDQLVAILDGKKVLTRIASIADTHTKEVVYNLSTRGEHTFIAGGVVVHNFTVLRAMRTAACRLLEATEDMFLCLHDHCKSRPSLHPRLWPFSDLGGRAEDAPTGAGGIG